MRCKICQREFEPKNPQQRYCSDNCKVSARNANRRAARASRADPWKRSPRLPTPDEDAELALRLRETLRPLDELIRQ